jgi:drug/metabolite transporter (DMT)-like permease
MTTLKARRCAAIPTAAGARVSKTQFAVLFIVVLTIVGVGADASLKLASEERHVMYSKWLFIGIALSCAFAVGWMLLMRIMKLSIAGVIYGLASTLLLSLIGVLFFGERLSRTELAGVAAAMLAMVLLSADA